MIVLFSGSLRFVFDAEQSNSELRKGGRRNTEASKRSHLAMSADHDWHYVFTMTLISCFTCCAYRVNNDNGCFGKTKVQFLTYEFIVSGIFSDLMHTFETFVFNATLVGVLSSLFLHTQIVNLFKRFPKERKDIVHCVQPSTLKRLHETDCKKVNV